MNSPWQYFNMAELQCRGTDCCNHSMHMDTEFMAIIVAMRRELGFWFKVSSAFRCSTHNNNVSSTGFDGPHTTGKSIDLLVSHELAFRLVESAFRHGITGIGVKQSGDDRFIHLDKLSSPRPRIWSYS